MTQLVSSRTMKDNGEPELQEITGFVLWGNEYLNNNSCQSPQGSLICYSCAESSCPSIICPHSWWLMNTVCVVNHWWDICYPTCVATGSTLRFFFWFCLLVCRYTASCSLHLVKIHRKSTVRKLTAKYSCSFSAVSYWPVNDLFVVTTDEYFLLWCDDAQSISLAGPGLSICDVCAQIQVHRPLWQSAGLEGEWEHLSYFHRELGELLADIALVGLITRTHMSDSCIESRLWCWVWNERDERMRFEGITERGGMCALEKRLSPNHLLRSCSQHLA